MIAEEKEKGKEKGKEKTSEEEKNAKIQKITWSIVILSFAIMIPLLFVGSVKIEYSSDEMTVKVSGWQKKTISYEDITYIEKLDGLNPGSRTGGLGSFRLQAGNFHNSKFGNYQLYAYVDAPFYLALHMKDDKIIVVGTQIEEGNILLEKLKEHIRGRKNE